MAKTSTANNLVAQVRKETGKGASRRARRNGKVPAVLYGHGSDPQHLELDAHDFAAVLRHSGTNAVLTLDIDGKEQLALTNLLLPKIGERVVTVSSQMHLFGYVSLKDLNWKARPYSAWLAYGQSKLANLLFTKELQRLLDAAGSKVKAHAAHPGYSATNLQSHSSGLFGKVFQTGNSLVATDADFGARQTLYAASQDLPGDSFIGPRFAMRGPTGPTGLRSPLARDAKTATALWELSEQLTDTKFAL